MKKIYLFLIAVMFTHLALGQVLLTTPSGTYRQDFDQIGVVDYPVSSLTNWLFSPSGGTTSRPQIFDSLGYNYGSDNQARFYNYGSIDDTDRALGIVTSGILNTGHFGVHLKNTSGVPILIVNIKYKGERWRRNNGQDGLIAAYAINNGGSIIGGTWNPIVSLNFSITPGPAGFVNGNNPLNSVLKEFSGSILLENGDDMVIRFSKEGLNSQGLAVDDFQIEWGLTLPTDLLTFTGQSSENGNTIEWVTASETDFSHFELESSSDNAKEFQQVTKVFSGSVQMNDAMQYEYSFFHPTLKVVNYYRLKQVDLNGDMSYSNVIKVNRDFDASCEFAVVPNPIVGNQLIINATQPFFGKIIITDLSGKEVYSESIASAVLQHRVDVTHLNPGVYYLSIETPSEEKILKFMK